MSCDIICGSPICFAAGWVEAAETTNKKDMKLYIFDFDGTLGDSRGLIVRTMMDTFDFMGLHRPPIESCISVIGLPLADCFVESANISKEESEKCADVYRKIFKRNNVKGAVRPFEGVIPTLKALHRQGSTLAVASSRGHESLDDLLSDFGITDLFSLVVGADDVAKAKPDPEPVERIMAELGFSPRETMVIGDAPYDIMMGRNAGAKTCGVTYGNGAREELAQAGADVLIDRFADLLKVVPRLDGDSIK